MYNKNSDVMDFMFLLPNIILEIIWGLYLNPSFSLFPLFFLVICKLSVAMLIKCKIQNLCNKINFLSH